MYNVIINPFLSYKVILFCTESCLVTKLLLIEFVRTQFWLKSSENIKLSVEKLVIVRKCKIISSVTSKPM